MSDITITQNMLNTYSTNHAKFYVNDVAAFVGMVVSSGNKAVFKADNGWEFYKTGTSNTNVSYRLPTGGTSYFALSADFKTATVASLGSFSTSETVFAVKTQIGAVVPEPIVYTITQNTLNELSNAGCVMTVNGVPVALGGVIRKLDVVVVVGDSTVVLSAVQWVDGDGYRIDFVESSDNNFTYTPQNETVYTNTNITWTPVVVIPPDPIAKFSFSQAQIDHVTNLNGALYVDDVLAVEGTKFFDDSIAKIVTINNYDFIGDGVSYRNDDGFKVLFDVVGNVATSNLIGFDGVGLFTIETDLTVPNVKGFNDVFRLTPTQLREVTSKRFIFDNGQVVTDYGQYILGLIELPFAINSNIIIGQDFIKLGGYDTNIKADSLSVDFIKYNMGVINVPTIKNNLLDFKNTIAILHLPYSDSINIDVDYVVGCSISIEYVVNLYDGVVTINVSSSKINGVVNTSNVDMGITLPFANLETYPSANDPRSIKLGGDNGIKIPYIEILKNDSVLENGFFTVPIIDEINLSGVNGYCVVENVLLETDATQDEKNTIVSMLNSGVVIK